MKLSTVILFITFSYIKVFAVPLTGTYTIGAGEDFESMEDVILDLDTYGVSGPTIFEFKNGTYTTHANITAISGASNINTITFTSQSRDSTLVNLTYDGNSSSNYIIRLDNAHYINFEHLMFEPLDNSYRNIIQAVNQSSNLGFRNCYFKGKSFGGTGAVSLSIASQIDRDDYNVIENNVFEANGYQLRISGSAINGRKSKRNLIKNNRFIGNATISIAVVGQEHLIITDNYFSGTRSGSSSNVGIVEIKNCGESIVISKNEVYVKAWNYIKHIRIEDCLASATKPFLLTNNFISGYGGTSSNLITCERDSFVYVYANSFNVYFS